MNLRESAGFTVRNKVGAGPRDLISAFFCTETLTTTLAEAGGVDSAAVVTSTSGADAAEHLTGLSMKRTKDELIKIEAKLNFDISTTS